MLVLMLSLFFFFFVTVEVRQEEREGGYMLVSLVYSPFKRGGKGRKRRNVALYQFSSVFLPLYLLRGGREKFFVFVSSCIFF